MGWWNKGIMDGDTPCDFAHVIEERLYTLITLPSYLKDVDEDEVNVEHQKEFSMIVEAALKEPAIIHQLMDIPNMEDWGNFSCGEDDDHIFWQTLGWMVMTVGGLIDPFKTRLLLACDSDEWAKTDGERARIVEAFKTTIKAYDNSPQQLEAKSLFESLADALIAGGPPGLINKNLPPAVH